MTEATRKMVGMRIAELRKRNKLSQQKLAFMVGVERSYISKVECGQRNATIDCLEKIAIGLDVPLVEFFRFDPPDSDTSVGYHFTSLDRK